MRYVRPYPLFSNLVVLVCEQTTHLIYKYVSLKSRSIPLLSTIVIMVAINPMRIPWLFVCPNASSLLGSQLSINTSYFAYSFHLCNHCRRLNLVSVLLEHWRELRRKWIHFILESLCFTETNRVLLLLKLQLHHLVRIRKAPVSCQFVSPLTVSRCTLDTI